MTQEHEESINPNQTDVSEKTESNQDVDFSEEELESLDDVTNKKLLTSIAQKKRWREKFEQEKKANAELKMKLKSFKPTKSKPNVTEKTGNIDKLQALELKIENPNLSMDHINRAIKYAEVEGVTPSEVINSSYFKAMISEETRQERVENATADPSNRAGSGRLNFERINSDESGDEYRKLSSEDRKKFREWLENKNPKGGLKFIDRQFHNLSLATKKIYGK